MLRMLPISSAQGLKDYFTQALGRGDYYMQDQEIVGQWLGKGAALLNLRGEVEHEPFFDLCDNLDPRTGKTLTARQRDNRKVGYEVTVSCPKSVSLAYTRATGQQKQDILEAFRLSLTDTATEMESAMQTQVGQGGNQPPRTTGNMIGAGFIHTEARETEGHAPDPDLHGHLIFFNATYDRKEQRWKAGEFHDIKQEAPYYQAFFHARLAQRIQALGLRTERTGKNWELADIPRSLIEKFSKRTAEIEAKAKALGITDPDAKGELGAKTRKRKNRNLDRNALDAAFDHQLSPADRKILDTVLSGGGSAPSGGKAITPEAALEYATTHCFTRASVVSEKQLLTAALQRGVCSIAPEEAKDALARAGVLNRTLEGRKMVTTREVLAEEQRMFAFARNGRGSCRMLGGVAAYQYRSDTLNDEQQAAVKHALTSHDRVMIIRGLAGTGKTTLMKEAVAELKAQSGKRVFTFAPSSDASRGTLREAGFKEAQTVAHLFDNEVLQQRLHGQVIWIDEAGLMSVPDMAALFVLAGRLNARVILSGDSAQHKAVNRGDSLRLLETKSGLRPAEVTHIMRQKETYREAVAAIAGGNLERGFALLDDLKWIQEVPADTGHAMLVRDYLTALREGKSTLVVSPTHKEGAEVTRQLRAALKMEGRIGANDHTFWTLRNLYWTEAERSDAARYEPGQVVQVFQNGRGIVRGERLQIEGRDQEGNVIALGRNNRKVKLPLDQAKRFQVFAPDRIGVAARETLRITQNGKTLNGKMVNNGDLCLVQGITEAGNLIVDKEKEKGLVLGQDFAHFTHGYVTTSHASQGKTVQRVFIAQGEGSFPASSLEQFYVSISRGQESCRIYTHDKEALKARVSESRHRVSATELLEGGITAQVKPVSLQALRELVAERYRRYVAQLEAVLGRTATLELVTQQEQTHERNREHGGRVMER